MFTKTLRAKFQHFIRPKVTFLKKNKLYTMALFSLAGYFFIKKQFENDQKTPHNNAFNALLMAYSLQTSFPPVKPKFNLEAFGGYEDVLKSLDDYVRYLQDPQEFTKNDLEPPHNLLLSGPPGVGKTMVAEALAGHAGVPFIYVSASSLIARYVGEGEENLVALFDAAKKNAPCVLCIDEFDSVGARRFEKPSQGSELHANTTVNQLLTLLSEKSQVVVVAISNNPDSLDPAITRAGRFDRHIFIPTPSPVDRLRILGVHTKNKRLLNVQLNDLVLLSEGFSGAELANWVNQAALLAQRQNSGITLKHFRDARSQIKFGSFGRSHTDMEQRKLVAIHESGHALVGHLLGKQLFGISIIQRGDNEGQTEFLENGHVNMSKEEILNQICCSLAGRAAEEVYGFTQAGSQNDFDKAKYYADLFLREGMGPTLSGLYREKDIEIILQEQMSRAKEIIENNEKTFKQLTEQLTEYEEIDRTEFLTILDGKKIRTSWNLLGWINPEEKPQSAYTLPPAKQFSRKISEDGNGLPFTKAEVAVALEIEEDRIRSITLEKGGYKIQLKPSCRSISSYTLNLNNVDHTINQTRYVLLIHSEGADDFVTFVSKQNKIAGNTLLLHPEY